MTNLRSYYFSCVFILPFSYLCKHENLRKERKNVAGFIENTYI